MDYNDTSSDSFSSSEEDDLDFLVCELAFRPKCMLGPCLNLADLTKKMLHEWKKANEIDLKCQSWILLFASVLCLDNFTNPRLCFLITFFRSFPTQLHSPNVKLTKLEKERRSWIFYGRAGIQTFKTRKSPVNATPTYNVRSRDNFDARR